MQISQSPSSKLTKCIFAGPTLNDVELDGTIERFGPAQLGSVYLAAKSGYSVIGLVDGIFGNVPAVWHKEILYALNRGCAVLGSSSIGALRAAELHAYGMRGIGVCYRLYRSGAITDDDEVAVLHGDETTNYAHLSEPLINVRLTLRDLRRCARVSAPQEAEIVRRFKAIHFSHRTFAKLKRTILATFGDCEGNRIDALIRSHYRDAKKEDGLKLAAQLMSSHPARNPPFFLRTANWRRQFEELESELNPLG